MPVSSQFSKLEAQCLRDGVLFEDTKFPAEDTSLDANCKICDGITWKRPKEISDNPQFLIDGASRFDLFQGDLGDCCFVASAAVLATKRDLFHRVVPEQQSFDGNYAGIFYFNFWWYGEWIEVLIDDRLPVKKDGKLCYAQNRQTPDEFWPGLLEKAYAKLYGSYEKMRQGYVRDALVDFTGGISESFNLKKKAKVPSDLYEWLRHSYYDMNALMGCGIWPDRGQTNVAMLPNGLFSGHAYSITELAEVSSNEQKEKIIRLRNPWGHKEWNGKWCDGAKEWTTVSTKEKMQLGVKFEDDGEFWMCFNDFLKIFHILDIVHLGPSSFSGLTTLRPGLVWQATRHYGSWIHGLTAGGSGTTQTQKELYYSNPQYHLTIKLKDTDDDNQLSECTCIISLMQILPPRRRLYLKTKPARILTGFDVHQVRDGVPEPLLGQNYSERAFIKKQFQTRTIQREVCCQLKLEPGVYCIIPNTLKPNQEGDFLLRVFTLKDVQSNVIDENTGPVQRRMLQSNVIDAVGNNTLTQNQGLESNEEENERSSLKLSKEVFLKYAGDDYVVDARDLRVLLNKLFRKDLGDSGGFTVEPCRCLLAMHDTDGYGYLNYEETCKLWNELRYWRHMFKMYDGGKSGFIETFALRKLFKDIGFKLSLATVSAIAVRYGGKQEMLSFEDFVLCAARANAMYKAFLKFSKTPTGDARINLDQWMRTSMNF